MLLRRGLKDALGVLALGLLPALIWWLQMGDPRVLLVLLGSSSLALVLRASESWVRTLLVSVALGLVYSVMLGAAFRPQIEALSQEIVKILPLALGDLYQQLSVDERARFASLIAPVLTGLIAALLQVVSVLSLILGRYWQALLYNPVVLVASFAVSESLRGRRCCCWRAWLSGRTSVHRWPCWRRFAAYRWCLPGWP